MFYIIERISQNQTWCMFRPVFQEAPLVGRQTTLFGPDRQVAAPGAKSAVSDCILFIVRVHLVNQAQPITTTGCVFHGACVPLTSEKPITKIAPAPVIFLIKMLLCRRSLVNNRAPLLTTNTSSASAEIVDRGQAKLTIGLILKVKYNTHNVHRKYGCIEPNCFEKTCWLWVSSNLHVEFSTRKFRVIPLSMCFVVQGPYT